MLVYFRLALWLSATVFLALLLLIVGYANQVDAVEEPQFILEVATLNRYQDEYLIHVNRKCGGVLLDETHVITAAHCVSLTRTRFGEKTLDPTDVEQIDVSFGDQEVGVIDVAVHPGYDSDNPEGSFDLAVLEVDAPITGAKTVTGIVPPNQIAEGSAYVLVARNSGPREVQLSQCPDNLGGAFYSYEDGWFRCVHHAALNHIGTCVGDSGSPILSINEAGDAALITIHHAAHTLADTQLGDCERGGESHEYGVAIMVAQAGNWIEQPE